MPPSILTVFSKPNLLSMFTALSDRIPFWQYIKKSFLEFLVINFIISSMTSKGILVAFGIDLSFAISAGRTSRSSGSPAPGNEGNRPSRTWAYGRVGRRRRQALGSDGDPGLAGHGSDIRCLVAGLQGHDDSGGAGSRRTT